jgi:glycosyltransferase involved in cell wall biosynthesis
MKPRLLISTDAFLPHWDGVARFLAEIIPRLKDDYNITVVCPEFEGSKPEIEDVKIIRMPLLKIRVADTYLTKPQFKRIKKIVEKQDIVFNQTIGPIGYAAIKAAKKLRKPVISYIHIIEWDIVPKSVMHFRWFWGRIVKRFARKLYNKCNLLLVPSSEAAATLRKNRIKAVKGVVHLGINSEKFIPADRAEAKKKSGIDSKDFVIGYCGRLGREKNLVTLYRAFVQLQKERKKVKLLVVGSGVEDVEELFKGKQGVVFTGSKDNVVPYLQAMDIYVLPSLVETTSLSTMEAMSCGCAVLVTKVGLIKEYVRHRKNGMFFPTRNTYMLRKRIEELIDKKELRENLGRNARETIVRNYSWERTVYEIKKILSGF